MRRWRYLISVAVTVVWLAACSFGMRGVDPKWTGTAVPDCSDSTIVIDRIIGISLLITGLGVIGARQDSTTLQVGGITAGLGVVYELSAVRGAHVFAECQAARRQWSYSNAIVARTAGRAADPTGAQAARNRPVAVLDPQRQREDRPWAAGVSDTEQAAALELYVAGNQDFAENKDAQALAKYRQAITHWNHPAIHFNIAVCLIHLDRLVEAREHLVQSLAYGSSALGRDAYLQGLAYLKMLDGTLVRLTLDCPEPDEEVMLDGELVFTGPGQIDRFVLPGEHQIVATKPGFVPASKKIVVVAGQPASYEIRPIIDPRSRP